jgi:citrate lyase beta subunit
VDYLAAWKRIRSLFEAPILDERKWAKVPTIPADAFILDMEDAVPLDRKEEGRAKVLEYLKQPDYFNGAVLLPRCNHLETPWGRDDVIALAEAGIDLLMYPKTESVEDLQEVIELCRAHGSDPKIFASIESAHGFLEMANIIKMDEVVVSSVGVGDLHVDVGMTMWEPDGRLNPALYQIKVMTVLTCAAYGKAKFGMPFVQDIKDYDAYRRAVDAEKRMGVTGCPAFYPPHVPILNEMHTPTEDELKHAREVVELYEAAVAAGNPAVQLDNGEVLLVHEYKEAQNVLVRAR